MTRVGSNVWVVISKCHKHVVKTSARYEHRGAHQHPAPGVHLVGPHAGHLDARGEKKWEFS